MVCYVMEFYVWASKRQRAMKGLMDSGTSGTLSIQFGVNHFDHQTHL